MQVPKEVMEGLHFHLTGDINGDSELFRFTDYSPVDLLVNFGKIATGFTELVSSSDVTYAATDALLSKEETCEGQDYSVLVNVDGYHLELFRCSLGVCARSTSSN
jgi:hypothetical protein